MPNQALEPGWAPDAGDILDRGDVLPNVRLDDLPASVRERVEHIKAEADAASHDGHADQVDLQHRLDEARAAAARMREVGARDEDVANADAEVKSAELAFERFRSGARQRRAVGQAWRNAYGVVARHLRQVQHDTLKPLGTELPSEPIDDLVRRLGDIDAERAQVDAAWPMYEHAVAEARRQVNQLADSGKPRAAVVQSDAGRDGRAGTITQVRFELPWRTANYEPALAGQGRHLDGIPIETDVDALACWALREEMLQAAESALESAYASHDGLVMDESDRRARLRALAEQRLSVERQVAASIWARVQRGDSSAVFPAGLSAQALLDVA